MLIYVDNNELYASTIISMNLLKYIRLKLCLLYAQIYFEIGFFMKIFGSMLYELYGMIVSISSFF